ncbi:MAG: 16S rRNA (adenine(1518)-N(6)/adenine(1519)-N(6))-dimethyltransferase RsmA [Anaerolineaceae bacterium]|nr:16S rRNA (adenine(1518)-N(6)/adenine(1519)-N(6))-dimethyltransferase RsmA [Anaerolineaceae bacterium]
MDPALNPVPPLSVARLLRQYDLTLRKGMGQNFLIDETALARIVAAAEISTDSAVLEIGPGLGSLTRYLAEQARKVIAVELDDRFLPVLAEVLEPWDNVTVIHGDILNLQPDTLMRESGYLVVANIPYYITSAVIRHLLEAEHKPQRIVLTIQEEVARRVCAEPGSLSLLALSVQVYGQPKLAVRIPAGAFYPPPKVNSAALRIDLYPEPRIPAPLLGTFFSLAKAGFSQKRKTLRNSLRGGMGWPAERAEKFLTQAGIDPQRRAQTLTLEEWGRLCEVVRENQHL